MLQVRRQAVRDWEDGKKSKAADAGWVGEEHSGGAQYKQ
jgi:hypothetical protein